MARPVITSNGTGGGNWNDVATWQGGTVPDLAINNVAIHQNDIVTIPAGLTLEATSDAQGEPVIDIDPGMNTAWLCIYGSLTWNATTLGIINMSGNTLVVENGGVLTLINTTYNVNANSSTAG